MDTIIAVGQPAVAVGEAAADEARGLAAPAADSPALRA
jgi:hypothetical protein